MPRKRTRVRTSTVTNTQIMLATLAAFLANGFALAAVPATKVNTKPPVLSCKAEIIASARICQYGKNVAGFRSFSYRCPNGKTYNVSTSCRSRELMQKLANDNCEKRKDCAAVVAKPVTVPTPPALKFTIVSGQTIKNIGSPSPGVIKLQQSFVDLAFVGRPEENINFSFDKENNGVLTVQYINRGPGDLQVSTDESQRAKVLITLLNQSQQLILFEPESFMPVLARGESVKTSFQISPEGIQKIMSGEAKFFKVELKVGNRKVGDQGIFDPDILNNTSIFNIPYKFPFPKGEDPL